MSIKAKMLFLEFLILTVICSFNHRLLFGLLWVLIHEFAHLLTSKSLGARVFNIRLHFTGARGKIQGMDVLSSKQKIVIYVSGPIVNILASGILLVVSKNIDAKWIIDGIWINLCLGIFNMIPAYPLDGARIYEIILGEKLLYKITKNILVKSSLIISGILIILFSITVYIHKANLSLILTAILITYSTMLEKRNTMYILMVSLFRKRRRLIKNEYIENKNISIYYKCSLGKALTLVDANKYSSFFVLNEGLELMGIIYEDELIEALKKYGNISFGEYLDKNYKT